MINLPTDDKGRMATGGMRIPFFMAAVSAFLTGFTILAYEIIASKALFYFFNESTYSTATVIAIFLFGLAVGSFVFAGLISKITNGGVFFLRVNWAVALYAVLILPQFSFVPGLLKNFYDWWGDSFLVFTLAKFFVSIIYLIVPTVLLGMLFPFILQAVAGSVDSGKVMSRIYGFDLLGAIAGALVGGFLLIPQYGLKVSIFIVAFLNLWGGIILLESRKQKMFFGTLAVFLSIFGAGWMGLTGNQETKYARLGQWKSFDYSGHKPFSISQQNPEVMFFRNSPFGEIRVAEYVRPDNQVRVRTLYINSRPQCDNYQLKYRNLSETHFVENALGAFVKENLQTLNIGLGCGFSLSTLAQDPRVAHTDVVEINPVIVEAAKYFEDYTNQVLKNPKVGLIIDDGYRYILNSTKKYDLIAIDIENPIIIHASALYTREFFSEVRVSLKQGGVLALWTCIKDDPAPAAVIYRTLKQVFPYVYIKKSGVYGDRYFYASSSPVAPDSLKILKEDMEFTELVKAVPDVRINTLDQPALNPEWFSGY